MKSWEYKDGTLRLGDCLEVMRTLPDQSVDLVFGSPPYEDARTYGIAFKLKGQKWVDWMVEVFEESLRVCKGLVAFVVEGRTKNFQYSCTPALLMTDLHRKGICLRKPVVYHRVGIPGSSGPDWLRNDWEWVVCATNGGKLPWSDNSACGEVPKYGPGGAMSHRMKNGKRVGDKVVYQITGSDGYKDGRLHVKKTKYAPPARANPGNVIKCIVGGKSLGSNISHESDAPFPEQLARFFVKSFCPPDGVVLDPFMGSGTTLAVAIKNNRKFIGIDIRENQIALQQRRIKQASRRKGLVP